MKKAFEPIINKNSTILILGTMPGEKSLKLQQYYGNKGNHFWKLIFTIYGEGFTMDYEARIELLHKHNIALWDVLQYCEREGSLDSKIRNEIPNNFTAFYSRHPNIKKVFFSSKKAAAYYDKYIARKEGLTYDVLPSPSGANATATFEQKLDIWKNKLLQ